MTSPPACCTGTPRTLKPSARITWTISRENPFGVITGEVGVGKTVAVRAALAALDPTRHTIIYIGNPATGVRGIHHHIVTALGGRPAHGYRRPHRPGLRRARRRGRRTRLVSRPDHRRASSPPSTSRAARDRPHAHQPDLDAGTPFATMIIGQPTLRRTMKLAVLAALDQRVALRYQMPP